MKKFVAVLLCFAAVFAFAACTNKPDTVEETTTAEPTGAPGAWVTDAEGSVVTTLAPVLDLDENGQPQLDSNGVVMTTLIEQIVTYPAAEGETVPPKTTLPTVAPGNTIRSENAKWPEHEFMSKLPKAADKVDKATYQTNEDGSEQLANIYINELSYADFLSYIEACKKAGFAQKNTGTVIPDSVQAGKSYIYSSAANGLYITLTYYTDEYPYRSCDLLITVTNYDILAKNGLSVD